MEAVFIQFWINRATLAHIKNLRVYLYVATKNTAFNYLRKTNRKSHYEFFDYTHVEIAASDPNPE